MTDEALIIVDLQNDYFPGGRWPLVGIEEAAGNGRLVLSHFREKDMAVVHIRHEFPADNAPFFCTGFIWRTDQRACPAEGRGTGGSQAPSERISGYQP